MNEEVCKSEAAKAVQSIPAYVEAADLFIALVPEVKHQERKVRVRFGGTWWGEKEATRNTKKCSLEGYSHSHIVSRATA